MNKSERDALVKQYTQGHSVVIEALAGITPTELDARRDGWTAREVVHHLADSESGRYTPEDWLQIYAAHGHDHAAQIDRARAGN